MMEWAGTRRRGIEVASPFRGYELGATPLGEGWLGELYPARGRSGDLVAIRITEVPTRADLLADLEALVGIHEAVGGNALARLRAVDSVRGALWYAQDLLSGGQSIRQYIHRRGALKPAQAIDLTHRAAMIVDSLHRAGVIHQDISTNTLMLLEDGSLRLLEAGVVAILARAAKQPSRAISPHRRAPGPVSGPPSPSLDTYALGNVLFFLLTGERAFPEGATALQLAGAIEVELELPGLKALPRQLRAVVAKALATRQADRYQTVAELIMALNKVGASR